MFNVHEYFNPSHRRKRACDACSLKKIRCDRQDVCHQCASTGTICVRNRPNRRHGRIRIEDESMRIMYFASCEAHNQQARDYPPRPRPSIESQPTLDPTQPTGTENQLSESLARLQHVEASGSRTNGEDSDGMVTGSRPKNRAVPLKKEMQLVSTQAHAILQSSFLFCTKDLDKKKASVAREVLTLAASAVSLTSSHVDDADLLGIEDPFPSSETIGNMITWKPQNESTRYVLSLGSILSHTSLESQGIALIAGIVEGPARNHYIVSINYAAWIFLHAKAGEISSVSLRTHLIQSQKSYEKNMIIGLQRISVADSPTLSLFQALLSGAMFAFHVGCFERCWQFNAAASRTFSALGVDFFFGLASGPNDSVASEIRHCIGMCYRIDKALSQTMNRKSCFPNIDLGASIIAPSFAHSQTICTVNILLDLGKIQDDINRVARSSSDLQARLQLVEGLQQRMLGELKFKINEARNYLQDSGFWRKELHGIEFAYFAILTTNLRLHPNLGGNRTLQEHQITYAHEALRHLTDMVSEPSDSPDFYAIRNSLAWKFNFYPMTPFFILLSWTIKTANITTFRFLSHTLDQLAMVSFADQPMGEVVTLLRSYLDCGKPLFESSTPNLDNGAYYESSKDRLEFPGLGPRNDNVDGLQEPTVMGLEGGASFLDMDNALLGHSVEGDKLLTAPLDSINFLDSEYFDVFLAMNSSHCWSSCDE